MKYIAPVAGSRWNILRVGVSLKIQKRVFYFMTPTNGVEISVSRLIEVLTQTMEKNVSVMN